MEAIISIVVENAVVNEKVVGNSSSNAIGAIAVTDSIGNNLSIAFTDCWHIDADRIISTNTRRYYIIASI